MDNARKVAVRAYESGYSERRLAAALGVDRMTIRTWLGKPTGREKLC